MDIILEHNMVAVGTSNNLFNYLHRWLLILCLVFNQRNYDKATDTRSFVK